jgi:glycerol-3-phosphate dehydrogenase
MWAAGFRDEIWSRLDQSWDLVIVGGGITGAGILGEAARLGKKVLLVEAQDFSSGTSSRSTKLVHGGLRYLRQGQFLLTRKSVRERERLLDEGKGLITALPFSLTKFPGDQMPKWMYGVGLAMYDVLAWKWAHEPLSKAELLKAVPALSGSTVQGGYRYFDAQTDDARLVLRVLREAVRDGGTAINYAKAEKLLRSNDGRVSARRDQCDRSMGRRSSQTARA